MAEKSESGGARQRRDGFVCNRSHARKRHIGSRSCTPATDSVPSGESARRSRPSPIFLGVRERLVVQLDHLKEIGGSALTDERIRVPEGEPNAPVGREIPSL